MSHMLLVTQDGTILDDGFLDATDADTHWVIGDAAYAKDIGDPAVVTVNALPPDFHRRDWWFRDGVFIPAPPMPEPDPVPEPAPDPAQLAAELAAALHTARAARLAQVEPAFALAASRFTLDGVPYQSDTAAQMNFAAMAVKALAALAGALPWPTDFEWIAADNTRVPLDAAGMLALANAAGEHVRLARMHARSIKDALLAADTVAEINAVDTQQGWP